MKRIIVVLLSVFVLCSCSKKLNIEVKDTQMRGSDSFADYYTVENKSGAEIKSVEFTINNTYFYICNIPEDGTRLKLEEFTTKDGRRFDIYEIKPLVLTAKSKAGNYSVNFSDIPYEPEPEVVEINGVKMIREILKWEKSEPITVKTDEGGELYIQFVFGDNTGKEKEVAKSPEVMEKLRNILATKTEPDFHPKNEDDLAAELCRAIGVKVIRFAEIEYKPAE